MQSTGYTRTVRLHGELGERFGREWKLDVNSPAEAIHAIAMQRDDFIPAIRELSDRGAQFQVVIGREQVGEDDLYHPLGRRDLLIVPVIGGAGDDSGVVLLVAGIVLIAVAAVLTLGAGTALIGPYIALLGPYAGTLAFAAGSLGTSLALSGISQMIAGTPNLSAPDRDKQESPEHVPSHHFGGPVNTVGQGRPVPVVYGRVLVGGHRISMGVTNN